MSGGGLVPRRMPRQRRSRATIEVILEASTRVLAADGLTGFTTNRVAEVAEVSIGSLYQYYPNKAALVAALIARVQAGYVDEIERLVAATATLPLAAALREFAVFAVRQQYDNPRLAAALDAEEDRLPVGPILRDAEGRIRAAIAALAARYGHADPAAAACDLFVVTKALVEADHAIAAPPSDLTDRLHRLFVGYFTPL